MNIRRRRLCLGMRYGGFRRELHAYQKPKPGMNERQKIERLFQPKEHARQLSNNPRAGLRCHRAAHCARTAPPQCRFRWQQRRRRCPPANRGMRTSKEQEVEIRNRRQCRCHRSQCCSKKFMRKVNLANSVAGREIGEKLQADSKHEDRW